MKVEKALLYLKGFVSITRITHLVNKVAPDNPEIMMVNAIDIICDECIKLQKEKK